MHFNKGEGFNNNVRVSLPTNSQSFFSPPFASFFPVLQNLGIYCVSRCFIPLFTSIPLLFFLTVIAIIFILTWENDEKIRDRELFNRLKEGKDFCL